MIFGKVHAQAYSDFISFSDLTVQAEEELSVKTKLDNFSRVKEGRRRTV